MNYKVIYLKLKERYPDIAEELTPKQRPLDGYEMLKVFTLFCKIKGVPHLRVERDKEDLRDLFIAVFLLIYDPDYFMCKKQLRQGLRDKLGLLLCHTGKRSGISHFARMVRDYMRLWKGFKEEAEYIYQTIKFELDGKAEKEAGAEEVEAGEVRADS